MSHILGANYGAGIFAHSGLTGLDANDHPQYSLSGHAHSQYLLNDADDETTGRLTTSGYTVSGANGASASGLRTPNVQSSTFGSISGFYGGTENVNYSSHTSVEVAAGTFTFASVFRGLALTYDLIDNGSSSNGTEIYPLSIEVDANGAFPINDEPISFSITNPEVGQSFTNGFISVTVEGGASAGESIACFTRATSNGAGSGIGYKGYATGKIGGTASGACIGVQGFAAPNAPVAHSEVVAVDGALLGIGADNTPAARMMGLRSTRHILCRQGHIILATGSTSTVATPEALTGVTDHLNFETGAGGGFFQSDVEIDGELFADGNISNSFTAITGSYTAAGVTTILANTDSGDITVTLPAVAGLTGREYRIKNIGSGITTIDGNASELIDTQATQTLSQLEAMQLLADGTEWWILT